MKLDWQKCIYMEFSRSESKFATRLKINNITMDKIKNPKILWVLVSEDLRLAKTAKKGAAQ